MYIDEDDIKRNNVKTGYDEKRLKNYRYSIIQSYSSLIEKNNHIGLKRSNSCRKNLNLFQNDKKIDKKHVKLIIDTYEKARFSYEPIDKKDYTSYMKIMTKLIN